MLIATPLYPLRMHAIKYCSSSAFNQATKATLNRVSVIPQNTHPKMWLVTLSQPYQVCVSKIISLLSPKSYLQWELNLIHVKYVIIFLVGANSDLWRKQNLVPHESTKPYPKWVQNCILTSLVILTSYFCKSPLSSFSGSYIISQSEQNHISCVS